MVLLCSARPELNRSKKISSKEHGYTRTPWWVVPDAHETNETWHDIGPKHGLAIATIINGVARPAQSVGPKSQMFSEQ
jgi:hypothetical protein